MKIILKEVNDFLLNKISTLTAIDYFGERRGISEDEGIPFFKKNIYKYDPTISKIYQLYKTFFIFLEDGRIYMTYKCLLQEGDKLDVNSYKYHIQLIPFSYFLKKYMQYEEKWCEWYELSREFPFYKFIIENIEDCDCDDEREYIGCDTTEICKKRITLLNGDIYELVLVDTDPDEIYKCGNLLDIFYRFPDIWIKKIKKGKNKNGINKK